MRKRPLLPLLAAATLAAQEPLPFLDTDKGVEHGWAFTAGARLMDQSTYMGSNRNRVGLEPLVAAEYDRRFYLGSSQVGPGFGGGVHLARQGGFTWDLGAGIGDRRPETRSPLLDGMGDRRADLFAGTGLHYQHQGFRAGLTLSCGLRDTAGNRATLTLGQMIPLAPGWYLGVGLDGTWTDANAMNYDFGITPTQAANRSALVAGGDPNLTAASAGPFTAPAGMRDVGARAGLSYRASARLVWLLEIHQALLLGDIRNSPLVGRNNYGAASAGFAYHF
jgi:outer membrane scaffolding protein for murein synthesis (MipA/OmpV family)